MAYENSVYEYDENGKLCVRVIGATGGGDQHNLGWYATQSALETAHPTAEEGDWAIVGSTDTVWVWDSDNDEWKDTDQKGQVESVNGQTGVVSLDINDVAPTQTGKSGYVLGTDGFVAGWVRPEIVQRSTLPVASEEEVGKIYQYVGATDANYTNGYFYKCVSDGQNPATYSWENIEVQDADFLPSQSGQSGKFLKTNGTTTSWGNAIENQSSGTQGYAIGDGSSAGNYAVALGSYANASGINAVAIGSSTTASATNAIQIGGSSTNSNANTLKVGNANGNFEMMSADGTIPEARLADMTNAAQGQVLTLDSNNNAVWATPGGGGGGSTATTALLDEMGWSGNSQTVNVTGVTASNNVIVAAAPASQAVYSACGIICTAQGAGTLTFTCDSVPTTGITVNVLII